MKCSKTTEAVTSVSFSRFAGPYKINEIQINGRTGGYKDSGTPAWVGVPLDLS